MPSPSSVTVIDGLAIRAQIQSNHHVVGICVVGILYKFKYRQRGAPDQLIPKQLE